MDISSKNFKDPRSNNLSKFDKLRAMPKTWQFKNIKIVNKPAEMRPPKNNKFTFGSVFQQNSASNPPVKMFSNASPGAINININHLNINSINYSGRHGNFKPSFIDKSKITAEIMKSKALSEIIINKNGKDRRSGSIDKNIGQTNNFSNIKEKKEVKINKSKSTHQPDDEKRNFMPNIKSLIDDADDSFVDECKEILSNVEMKQEKAEERELDDILASDEAREQLKPPIDLERMRACNIKRPETSYGSAKDRIRSGQQNVRKVSSRLERPKAFVDFGMQNRLGAVNKQMGF